MTSIMRRSCQSLFISGFGQFLYTIFESVFDTATTVPNEYVKQGEGKRNKDILLVYLLSRGCVVQIWIISIILI